MKSKGTESVLSGLLRWDANLENMHLLLLLKIDDLPSPKKVVNPLFNIFKDKKKTTNFFNFI